jgi:hypothetical protein
LKFTGNIEFDDYRNNEEEVALVFKVEYKVLINMKENEEKMGEFAKFIRRITGKSSSRAPTELSEGIEKLVNVGWGILLDSPGIDGNFSLNLNYGYIPNPFPSFIYRAFESTYATSMRDIKNIEAASRLVPLTLQFAFSNPEFKTQPITSPLSIPPPQELNRNNPPEVKTVSNLKIQTENETTAEVLNEVRVENSGTRFKQQIDTPKVLSNQKLNRIQAARFQNAGFEIFLDENGHKPIDTSDDDINVYTDYNLELNDGRANKVILQIMGVTFNDGYIAKNTGLVPNSLIFSLKFFDKPAISTERAKLYLGETFPPKYQQDSDTGKKIHQRTMSELSHSSMLEQEDTIQWPGILYKYQPDNRPGCINILIQMIDLLE